MPRFSSEWRIGLLLDVVVILVDQLRLAPGYIVWPLFGFGLLLIADGIYRGEWKDRHEGIERKRRMLAYTGALVVLVVAGAFLIAHQLSILGRHSPATQSAHRIPEPNAPVPSQHAIRSLRKPVPIQAETRRALAAKHSAPKPAEKNLSRPTQKPQPTYNVTNPRGSIVNQGSTISGTQTVNNGPPPPNLTYREEPVSEDGDLKVLRVHVSTDRTIPGAVIGILFSGPIILPKPGSPYDPQLKGSIGYQINWANLMNRGEVLLDNGISLTINFPAAFTPGEDLVVTIESKTEVHVTGVGQPGL